MLLVRYLDVLRIMSDTQVKNINRMEGGSWVHRIIGIDTQVKNINRMEGGSSRSPPTTECIQVEVLKIDEIVV